MRRYLPNEAVEVARARKIREDFHDKPAAKRYEVDWDWPQRVLPIGTCEAVMYSSDKWEKPRDYHDYKHVAEGPQLCFASPRFVVRGLPRPNAPTVRVANLPRVIAELDPILAVQVRCADGDYYQINIPRCLLGASKTRDGRHTFLVVYSKGAEGDCHLLITGPELDVTKDGIVG